MRKRITMSAEDIEYEIYRRMTADQSVKLGSDFSMMCLKIGCREGAPVPMRYLMLWLSKNIPKLEHFAVRLLKNYQ